MVNRSGCWCNPASLLCSLFSMRELLVALTHGIYQASSCDVELECWESPYRWCTHTHDIIISFCFTSLYTCASECETHSQEEPERNIKSKVLLSLYVSLPRHTSQPVVSQV